MYLLSYNKNNNCFTVNNCFIVIFQNNPGESVLENISECLVATWLVAGTLLLSPFAVWLLACSSHTDEIETT